MRALQLLLASMAAMCAAPPGVDDEDYESDYENLRLPSWEPSTKTCPSCGRKGTARYCTGNGHHRRRV